MKEFFTIDEIKTNFSKYLAEKTQKQIEEVNMFYDNLINNVNNNVNERIKDLENSKIKTKPSAFITKKEIIDYIKDRFADKNIYIKVHFNEIEIIFNDEDRILINEINEESNIICFYSTQDLIKPLLRIEAKKLNTTNEIDNLIKLETEKEIIDFGIYKKKNLSLKYTDKITEKSELRILEKECNKRSVITNQIIKELNIRKNEIDKSSYTKLIKIQDLFKDYINQSFNYIINQYNKPINLEIVKISNEAQNSIKDILKEQQAKINNIQSQNTHEFETFINYFNENKKIK